MIKSSIIVIIILIALMTTLQESSQQLSAQIRSERTITKIKFCLLLGISAVFILTMKHENSRMLTFLWYASGLGLIWFLCDICARHTITRLTEFILRCIFQAAHYLVKLLFLDLWNSRPKKKR